MPGDRWTFSCPRCGWIGEGRGRPRCKPCHASSMNDWRRNNPEKAKAQKRRHEFRIRNFRPEKYAEKLSRPRNRASQAASRKRRLDWYREGDVTQKELRAIVKRDGGCCVYCSTPVNTRCYAPDPRGFDHVLGRTEGGRHTASNLVVSCGDCNRAHIRKPGDPKR